MSHSTVACGKEFPFLRLDRQAVTERYDSASPDGLCAHGCLEIGMVVSGIGIHVVGQAALPCGENDLYVVPAGVAHGYFSSTDAPLVIHTLAFSPEEWLKGEAATVGSKRYCYGIFMDGAEVAYAMLNARMREQIAELWDAMEQELSARETDWQVMLRAHLTHLLILISRYVNCSVKSELTGGRDRKTLDEVNRILTEEFSDAELSLEGIAKRVFVSPSHLSRIFKAYEGQLFSDRLRQIRLNHAAALLSETDARTEQILFACGFRDTSSFYRNFREAFGITPHLYRQTVKSATDTTEIHLQESENRRKMERLNEISLQVQKGKAKLVKELVQTALDENVAAEDILHEGLLAGMSIIGEEFKNNRVYVPEVLVAARAMNMGMQILKPYLAEGGVNATGKVCIGTVQGDLHDIGKNLVKMMMEGKGLEVIDLGTDVAPETFVQTAINEGCQVICCSALLTTTMGVMGDVVKAAEAAGVRDKVKIIVGGAPVTQDFCRQIGADLYTPDAATAADAAVAFCKA